MIIDAIRRGLPGAGPQPDRRCGPWRLDYAGPDFAGPNRPMYRITCPSRARLHARSQVLAHAPWPDVPDNRPLSGGYARSAVAAGHRRAVCGRWPKALRRLGPAESARGPGAAG